MTSYAFPRSTWVITAHSRESWFHKGIAWCLSASFWSGINYCHLLSMLIIADVWCLWRVEADRLMWIITPAWPYLQPGANLTSAFTMKWIKTWLVQCKNTIREYHALKHPCASYRVTSLKHCQLLCKTFWCQLLCHCTETSAVSVFTVILLY